MRKRSIDGSCSIVRRQDGNMCEVEVVVRLVVVFLSVMIYQLDGSVEAVVMNNHHTHEIEY